MVMKKRRGMPSEIHAAYPAAASYFAKAINFSKGMPKSPSFNSAKEKRSFVVSNPISFMLAI